MARVMTVGEWAMLVVLAAVWGASFFTAEIALRELSPMVLVLARVGLAALALHLFLLVTGRRMPLRPGLWAAFFAMGFLNNLLPFGLIFWGQVHISSSLASILNATTPIWAVLLAHWLTGDERLTARRLAGVLAGFAGVTVMIGPAALFGLGTGLLAQLAVLGATISYAFAGIFARRFKGEAPIVTATGQLTGSTVMALPLVLAGKGTGVLTLPGLSVLAAIGFLALVSTAMAYILYFRILKTAGATNLLLVTFLVPVSAILLGTLILGERLEAMQIAGMALILLGLAIIDGRLIGFLRARFARMRPA